MRANGSFIHDINCLVMSTQGIQHIKRLTSRRDSCPVSHFGPQPTSPDGCMNLLLRRVSSVSSIQHTDWYVIIIADEILARITAVIVWDPEWQLVLPR